MVQINNSLEILFEEPIQPLASSEKNLEVLANLRIIKKSYHIDSFDVKSELLTLKIFEIPGAIYRIVSRDPEGKIATDESLSSKNKHIAQYLETPTDNVNFNIVVFYLGENPVYVPEGTVFIDSNGNRAKLAIFKEEINESPTGYFNRIHREVDFEIPNSDWEYYAMGSTRGECIDDRKSNLPGTMATLRADSFIKELMKFPVKDYSNDEFPFLTVGTPYLLYDKPVMNQNVDKITRILLECTGREINPHIGTFQSDAEYRIEVVSEESKFEPTFGRLAGAQAYDLPTNILARFNRLRNRVGKDSYCNRSLEVDLRFS